MASLVGYATLDIIPSLAGVGARLSTQLGGDLTRAGGRAGDDAGREAGKRFGSSLADTVKGVALPLAALAGAGAAVSFLKKAVVGASDLSETVNKSTVIFGQNAAAITTWAGGAAKNLGLSKAAALEAAAGLGNMFTQLGFTGQAATDLSTNTVKLAADLGSFNNLGTDDVLERIGGALRGEFDSLQALIPNINAARVETEALAATGKKNADQLTAQEKAAATLALINRDGAAAANDFAETSGGLANQQKILAAQFDDLAASAGTAFLPAVTSIVSGLNDALPAVTGLGSALVDVLGPGFDRAKAGGQGLLDFVTGGDFSGSLITALNLSPDQLGIVTALEGARDRVATAISGFSIDWAAVGTTLATGVENAVGPILTGLSTALSTGDTSALGQALGTAVASALTGLSDLAATLGTTLGTALEGIDWGGLALTIGQQVPVLLLGFVTGLLTFDIGSIFTFVMDNWLTILIAALTLAFAPAKFIGPLGSLLAKIPFVGKFLEIALKWLNDLGTKITADFLQPLFTNFIAGFRAAAPAFGRGFGSFLELGILQIRIWADDVLVFFRGIPGRIGKALNGLANEVGNRLGQMIAFGQTILVQGAAQLVVKMTLGLLKLADAARRGGESFLNVLLFLPRQVVSIGGDIIAGLVRGLTNGTGALVTKAKEIAGKITSTIKGALGIHSPSRVMIEVGEFVNDGLVIGLTSSADKVSAAVEKISDQVYKGFKDVVGAQIDAQTAAIDRNVDGLKKQVDALSKTTEARKKNAVQLERLDAQIKGLNDQRTALNDSVEATVNLRSQDLLNSIAFQTRSLDTIATLRDSVAEKIKTATKNLEDAVKLRDDFAASIASSAAAVGALGNIKGVAGEDGTEAAVTFDDIAAALSGATTATTDYRKSLEQLRTQGLNDDLFKQLAEKGAAQGQAYVDAILAAGPGAVQQLNQLQTDLGKASAQLGEYTAKELFQAGVDSGQGLLDGLTSREQELLDKATAIANGIAERIRKALDIHSPSRVMATIGRQVGAGLARGIDDSRGAVGAAVDALIPLPRPASTSQVAATLPSTSTGAGPGVVVEQHNTIERDVDWDLAQRRTAFILAGALG